MEGGGANTPHLIRRQVEELRGLRENVRNRIEASDLASFAAMRELQIEALVHGAGMSQTPGFLFSSTRD